MKVAVIGLADSSEQAPWSDPAWDKWGLAWDTRWPMFQRTFEMHEPADIEPVMPKAYWGELQHRTNLYMPQAYVPGSTAYPFDDVAKTTGPYWHSSVAYMLAQAIHERAEEIGLWGVDLESAEEYGYQKPNTLYLIGFAKGRGIKVHLPDSSPLFEFAGPVGSNYDGRYGRLR